MMVRDFPAMAGKWPRYPPELGASTVSCGSVATLGLKKGTQHSGAAVVADILSRRDGV